jgi:hypothetical protein
MDISEMSLIELKALGFDLILQRDQVNAALNAVVQEINKRKDGKNDNPDKPSPTDSQ